MGKIIVRLQLCAWSLTLFWGFKIKRLVRKSPQAIEVEFYSGGERITTMVSKVTKDLALSVRFKDAKGNAAKVDGAPKWSTTDPALATVEAAEDGMSAVLKPVGPLGTLKVQCSADADLGEGVVDIIGELEVELVAGDAEVVEISAS